ncbi:MAG TPA: thiamine ABC transporter substrate-binding protein, partial [Clostridiales bacterium]|nr:thiamine ABC transporter substrate-binding protein [Clostridiales bacterium]
MIVLSCNDISKAYVVDNIIENISFTVNDNEKIGLIGLNGAGKTTLFNILTEILDPDSGEIYRPKSKKLGYLKQNTSIESNRTIMDEMLTIYSDVIRMEEELHEMSHKISTFTENDSAEELEKLMESYSKMSEKFEE